MTETNYDKALEGLQIIKDSFNEDSEIYKQAKELEQRVINSQIPF